MATINFKAVNSQLFSSLNTVSDESERRKLENRIAELNARLVYKAAHAWSNWKNVPLPLDELYSIGLGGLLTAIRKFDPRYGVQFSTFATKHINGAIKRAIRDKGSLIKIPQSLQAKGKNQVRVGSLQFVPIETEDTVINLTREYRFCEVNEEVERWLAPFKDVHVTPSQIRNKCIDALNVLIEMGVVDQEKITGESVVLNGVEYYQYLLW